VASVFNITGNHRNESSPTALLFFLTLFYLIFSGLPELLPMVVGHPQPFSEKLFRK